MKIENIDMSVRLYHQLHLNGIVNIDNLGSLSKEDVIMWRNFGRQCLWELLEIMKRYNVSFNDGVN